MDDVDDNAPHSRPAEGSPLRRRVLMAALKLALGLGLFAGVLWWIAPDWQALREAVTIVPLGLGVALLGTTLASVVTA